jgi:hypothetical protein
MLRVSLFALFWIIAGIGGATWYCHHQRPAVPPGVPAATAPIRSPDGDLHEWIKLEKTGWLRVTPGWYCVPPAPEHIIAEEPTEARPTPGDPGAVSGPFTAPGWPR